MIIEMNKILKRNTSDEETSRYNIGGFKVAPNIIDVVDFHHQIHPFDDGFGDENGHVGRIIMFKECLKNNIMPFIVLDADKTYYMIGLKEYENNKMFLIDTIGHEQALYEKCVKNYLVLK